MLPYSKQFTELLQQNLSMHFVGTIKLHRIPLLNQRNFLDKRRLLTNTDQLLLPVKLLHLQRRLLLQLKKTMMILIYSVLMKKKMLKTRDSRLNVSLHITRRRKKEVSILILLYRM
jgi:hypothetical protein